MAMPLEASIRARHEAPLHVQLRLTRIPAQCPVPADEVSLEGQVVTVFRGHELLAPGARVTFSLWVCNEGDEPTGPAFVHYVELAEATHIEVYLYGTPPDCTVAAYEFVLLKGSSQVPTLSPADLE